MSWRRSSSRGNRVAGDSTRSTARAVTSSVWRRPSGPSTIRATPELLLHTQRFGLGPRGVGLNALDECFPWGGYGRRRAAAGLDRGYWCGHRGGLLDSHQAPFSVLLEHGPGAPVDELLVQHTRLTQQVLVALVAQDLERVEHLDVGVVAKRQPQAAAEGLLSEDLGHRRPHGGDDVDVLDVPAFFEHADRDDDAVRAGRVLDLLQGSQGLVWRVRVDRQHLIGEAPAGELLVTQNRFDLVGFGDAACYHQHDGIHRRLAALLTPPGNGRLLELQEANAVEQLGLRVSAVVLAADDDRGLNELVGDGGRQRVAVDDQLLRGLLVRRGGQANEHVRAEVADGVGEGGPVVGVVLVGEDDQVALLLQVSVERLAEAFLELVRLAAQRGLRLGERLNSEDEQLDLLRVVHG